jgi:hypothetical protein
MSERKVIAIACGIKWGSFERVVALCDDGTMWLSDAEAGWLPMTPVPQTKEETK